MANKAHLYLKMTLYVMLLILAELMQTSVFGNLDFRLTPSVMPIAVACIGLFEGSQRGCILGLVGGCLWAWSTQLSYYGAWCIVILTVIGTMAGLVTELYLLRGIQTTLCLCAIAMLLTEGMYLLMGILGGSIPLYALFNTFLPETVISLLCCLFFYPLTAYVAKIGGTHG